MSFNGIHGCSICGKPTYFSYRFYNSKPRTEIDNGLYEIGCTECGEYRVASTGEQAMTRQSPLYRANLVRLIQAANARGNRYCLDDGGEVSLSSVATPTHLEAVTGTLGRSSGPFAAFTPAGQMEAVAAATSLSPAATPSRTPEQR